MANRIQHLRGSLTEHSTFTGEKGEISLVTDTSANRIPTGELRVHDGTTAGGLEVPGVARAWVNFNGTLDENSGGLTAGDNVLIRASYNVSSVYYNGTGDYTINFATAMPDANYAISGSKSYESLSNVNSWWIKPRSLGDILTTSVRIYSGYTGASTTNTQDSEYNAIAIFR